MEKELFICNDCEIPVERRDLVGLRCRNKHFITEYLGKIYGPKSKSYSKLAEVVSVNGYSQFKWSEMNQNTTVDARAVPLHNMTLGTVIPQNTERQNV